MPVLDRWLMRLTGGRIASTLGMGMPTLLLIGTSFGSKSHPAWYLNLMANPRASVLMDKQSFDVIAREASPEETPVLWKKATQTYGGYEKYLERVGGREVPIIVLSSLSNACSSQDPDQDPKSRTWS